MTKFSPESVRSRRRALTALLLLTLLSACSTSTPRLTPTLPPRVACEQRAPAEGLEPVQAASTDWKYWYEKWLEAMGIAAAEVQKRVTTAQCLDALEKSGVIRQ